MQKFKVQENPNFFKNFLSDTASIKCQVFIDGVSLFGLSIALIVAGTLYKDFADNFLPMFYVGKFIICAFVWACLDETLKNANKKFLAARILCDLLMFIGGYYMMKGNKLDEMCYIIYCTVILLNLSASTICVLVMGGEESNQEPVNHAINREETEESEQREDADLENALIAKVKGQQNKESFISGSTAATFLTKNTKTQ